MRKWSVDSLWVLRCAVLASLAGWATLASLPGCGAPDVPPATRVAAAGLTDQAQCQAVPVCAAGLYATGCSCTRPLWAEVAPLPAHPLRIFGLLDFDGSRGWLVGEGGLVLRTLDGGTTVGRVDADTRDDLIAIDSYDDRHLLVTGATPTLGQLHLSDDGGRSWRHSAPGPAGLGQCSYAPSALAVCEDRTQGGHVYLYDLVNDRFSAVVTAASAAGPTVVRVGNAVGLALVPQGSGSTTLVMRSTDGGRSFVPGPTLPAAALSLWTSGNDTLAVIGTRNGSIYRTTDGGVSFSQVYENPAQSSITVSGADDTHIFAAAVVDFIDPVDFIELRNVVLLASTNGGASFQQKSTNVLLIDDPAPLSFGSKVHGLIDTGRLLATDDAGVTVRALDHDTINPGTYYADSPGTLGEVVFPTAEQGYVLSTAFHEVYPGPRTDVWSTQDGGASFGEVLEAEGPSLLRGLTAPDADHVFLLGEYPPFSAQYPLLYRTGDGGKTWTDGPIVTGAQNTLALAFGSDTVGLAVVVVSGVGQGLYRSSDGGASWTAVTLPAGGPFDLRALAFADATHAVAVGAGGVILQSSDGGLSFTLRRSGFAGQVLSTVAFASAQPSGAPSIDRSAAGVPVGWAGGGDTGGGGVLGVLLGSSDFGLGWTAQGFAGSATLSVVQISVGTARAATALVADAQGNPGLIDTADGGYTPWRALAAPSDQVRSIFRLPDGITSYAAADYGLYRHLARGGRR